MVGGVYPVHSVARPVVLQSRVVESLCRDGDQIVVDASSEGPAGNPLGQPAQVMEWVRRSTREGLAGVDLARKMLHSSHPLYLLFSSLFFSSVLSLSLSIACQPRNVNLNHESTRWDPVRGRRATTRMPPLPANRRRHPAYSYPTVESMELRVAKLREQQRRLATRKERLSALEAELAEAKSEVDSACADARSSELRERYGADTLRSAREAAKEAHSALVREKKSLSASVVEAEKMVRSVVHTRDTLERQQRR